MCTAYCILRVIWFDMVHEDKYADIKVIVNAIISIDLNSKCSDYMMSVNEAA